VITGLVKTKIENFDLFLLALAGNEDITSSLPLALAGNEDITSSLPLALGNGKEITTKRL
jgi:hypothetical protein